MWKATDVEPAFVDKPFASHDVVLLRRSRSFRCHDESAETSRRGEYFMDVLFREKTQQDESNASAVAALRPRARARKRARRVRARPWRRRCVRGRPRKGSTRAARAPRATGPDRGGAPRATRNRATAARRREASRCPAAGGCSCTTSGSSRRSRSGGTTSASRFLASRGGVAAHLTSPSRVRAPASFKCARISTTDKNAAGSFSSASPVADLGPPRATRSRRHPRSAPLYAERDIDAKRSRD